MANLVITVYEHAVGIDSCHQLSFPPPWHLLGCPDARHHLKLSDYVQQQFAIRQFPILADEVHQHGFLHRLDLPSSGLVMTAKTYQAFYDLMV